MARILLLVEDSRDDEALILRALRKASQPPRVLVAHDGIEALRVLEGEAVATLPWPDVVVLDLNLPKMTGLEVLRRIRAHPRLKRLPIVVLTSSREESDVATAYQLGASSYVRKPIGSEGFTSAILQIGAYWLELNEPPPPDSA
jgi:two-component system response regulator